MKRWLLELFRVTGHTVSRDMRAGQKTQVAPLMATQLPSGFFATFSAQDTPHR